MAEADARRLAGGNLLSTFVMIGQNRQASFLKTNTDLTRAIHALTVEIHSRMVPESDR